MTWFKVDDSFYDHPKVFDLPDSAVALWTRAGCWAARNLTDGFVPARMPARLCDDHDSAVRALIDRGLWKRTRGGYQFHDWDAYQPSSDDVKNLRAKRAEAGRRGGLAKAARERGGQGGTGKQTPSKPLASASDVAKQNAAPSRPDPKGRGSVGESSSVPDARAYEHDDDQDDVVKAIIGVLADETGRTVTPGHAERVRHQILGRRHVSDPARYIVASIRANPRQFLPSDGDPASTPASEAHRAALPDYDGTTTDPNDEFRRARERLGSRT